MKTALTASVTPASYPPWQTKWCPMMKNMQMMRSSSKEAFRRGFAGEGSNSFTQASFSAEIAALLSVMKKIIYG